jgi:hypothetical protein
LCKNKESRKTRIGLKELEQVMFVNKAMGGSEKIREKRKESRVVYKQESVVLGMNRSLVGVGDP